MSKIIANNTLEVRLDSYGNATVRQASCDAVWNPDQSESIPGIIHTKEGAINLKEAGRIDIRKLDAGFHIVYGDFVRNGQSVDGCLEATILLEGHDVVFRIDRLDLPCDLISVEYPYRAFALKAGTPDGYLVLPFRGGCLVPTEDVLLDPVAFWFACDHSRGTLARGGVVPSVPVFGARDARAGYVGVLETPTDVTLSYMLNYDEILRFVGKGERSPFDRLTVAWPNWLCQKGELGYARAVRYTFQENMDYVRMARHYREHARKTGLLVTLRDKEKARPQLGLIEGAPYVAYYAGYPHVAPPHPLFPYKYSDL
ncbi:MAG: hypothetical protein KAI66_18960, partial [Lentisphaeria bacterium]|nr:hypothetical protein [Lentisphaeria bacterium]